MVNFMFFILSGEGMIKKICMTIIIVFLLLIGYGAWIGAEQNQRGVSLFQVAYTYNSMNPISRIGYTFMLKKNHALVEGAGEVKKSLDSMISE